MATYSDDDIRTAGRILGDAIRTLDGRLGALEGKPQREALAEQWQEGRKYARSKGYGDRDLEQLESYMVKEGISQHRHAIAVDPVGPSGGSHWFLNALPEDE